MFSKAEAQQMKKEFWTAFAEAYPRKWLLYDTKIKDVSFKFHVDNKKAQVLLDIEPKEEFTLRNLNLSKAFCMTNFCLKPYLRKISIWRQVKLLAAYG